MGVLAKTFFIISSVVIFSFVGEEKIAWDSRSKITWDDYKGKVDMSFDDKAMTIWEIYYDFVDVENGFAFNVHALFDTKKSWSHKPHQSADLLKHEQGHFDIAEIYTRKFRQKIHDLKMKNKTLEQDLKVAHLAVMLECDNEQAAYDDETHWGLANPAQKKWDDKIAGRLKEFEKYAEGKFTISE